MHICYDKNNKSHAGEIRHAKKANEHPITMMVPLNMTFDEKNQTELQLLKEGEWNHPMYGPIKITEDNLKEFVANFKKNLRAHSSTIGLPVDEEHRSDCGAVGWIKELINRGKEGLFAIVEWNAKGRQLIEDAIYRFFSPEFYFQYEDPESRKVYNNVFVGGAITNRPYFKGLNPVVLSEDILINNTMLLSEVSLKNLADLDNDEKSFIASHFSELDEVGKTKFAELNPNKEAPAVGAPAGSVTMSEVEVKKLKDAADAGVKATEELKKKEMSDKIEKLVFSESNKEGKLPATIKEKVTAFAMSLNDTQATAFFEIVNGLPKATLFSEIGGEGGEGEEGEAPEGVEANSFKLDQKAKALIKANDKLSYPEALLMAEKELAKK